MAQLLQKTVWRCTKSSVIHKFHSQVYTYFRSPQSHAKFDNFQEDSQGSAHRSTHRYDSVHHNVKGYKAKSANRKGTQSEDLRKPGTSFPTLSQGSHPKARCSEMLSTKDIHERFSTQGFWWALVIQADSLWHISNLQIHRRKVGIHHKEYYVHKQFRISELFFSG